jgi:hypothetical protein
MKFHHATKTMFKPAFGRKRGESDFYQISIDGKPQAEIEVLPKNNLGKPEIMSLYVNPMFREQNLGSILVDKIKEIYLEDELYVLSTKDSKPFWLRIGAKESNDFLLKFTK